MTATKKTRLKNGAVEPVIRKELKKKQKTEATLKYWNVCYIRQMTGAISILGGRERSEFFGRF